MPLSKKPQTNTVDVLGFMIAVFLKSVVVIAVTNNCD